MVLLNLHQVPVLSVTIEEMASLSGFLLPDEVLLLVCRHLSSRDVARVMRCSRRLSGFVAQHLYTCIELDESNDGRGGGEFPRLRALTQKLLANPTLANRVRSLTVRPTFSDGDQWEAPRRTAPRVVPVPQELRRAVVNAPGFLGYSLAQKGTLLLHLRWADCADAVLAVLLPVLRGLQSLDLAFPFAGYHVSHVLRAVADAHHASTAGRPPPPDLPFCELTDAMHTWHDWFSGMEPDYISWFLQLPTVRRVFAHRVASFDQDPGQDLRSRRARSSAVQHLELKDCQLLDMDVHWLMRVPRALKTLIYQIGVSLQPSEACISTMDVALPQDQGLAFPSVDLLLTDCCI